jgi:hypothetical protein
MASSASAPDLETSLATLTLSDSDDDGGDDDDDTCPLLDLLHTDLFPKEAGAYTHPLLISA